VTLKSIFKISNQAIRGYLEHFKFDAGSTGSQPGEDRVRLCVGGCKERSSAMTFDIFGFNCAHSGSKKCDQNNNNLVLFRNESCYMA
jgi:hypothetical protein